MRRHRSSGSRDAQRAPGSPSRAARTRLAASVQREISDLRARILEASLRAQVLLEAGLANQAAEVMDEQRALVERFRERVQSAVASALVEREAEIVLASAPDAGLLGPEPDEQDDARAVRRLGVRLSEAMERLPATASAALAAVVALAALVLVDPPEPHYEGVADMYRARPVVSAPAEPAPDPPAPESGQPAGRESAVAAPTSPEPSSTAEASPAQEAASAPEVTPSPEPADLNEGVRWLLDRPRSLLARIAKGTSAAVRELLEIEGLTDLLPPESGTPIDAGGDADRDAGDDAGDRPSPDVPILDDLLSEDGSLLEGLDDPTPTSGTS